jgi:hypothetical protein
MKNYEYNNVEQMAAQKQNYEYNNVQQTDDNANQQTSTFTELVDGKSIHDAHHSPLKQRVIEQRRPHWRCWLARPHTGQVRRHEREKLPANRTTTASEKCRLQTSFNTKAVNINTDEKLCKDMPKNTITHTMRFSEFDRMNTGDDRFALSVEGQLLFSCAPLCLF